MDYIDALNHIQGKYNSLPIFKEGNLRAGLIVRWNDSLFPERLGTEKTVDYLFRCNGGCALCFKFTDGSDYNVSSWAVIGEINTEDEAKEEFFKKFPDCIEARFLNIENKLKIIDQHLLTPEQKSITLEELKDFVDRRIKYISKKLSGCIGYSKIEKVARIDELKFLLEKIEKGL